jgi:hypothetical protein
MVIDNLEKFKSEVNGETARSLAILAFKLNLSYGQMVECSGLSKEQFYRIKCIWVNKKKYPKFMKVDLANGLVKLIKQYKQVADAPKEEDQEIVFFVIRLMILKRGLSKVSLLLKKRGKTSLLKKYLKSLTVSQLADIL